LELFVKDCYTICREERGEPYWGGEQHARGKTSFGVITFKTFKTLFKSNQKKREQNNPHKDSRTNQNSSGVDVTAGQDGIERE